MNKIQSLLILSELTQIDLKNIESIEEFVIIEENEKDLYINMLKLSQEIDTIEYGNYSISINNKFFICFKSFEKKIKNIFLNILKKFEKEILCNDNVLFLKDISLICKFILIFIPEFITVYNIKLKLLEKIEEILHKKNFDKIDTSNKIEVYYKEYFLLLLENLKFINLISFANRKCCYSWFYRKNILSKIILSFKGYKGTTIFFLIKNYFLLKVKKYRKQ